jgi:hypothetical protein
VVDVEMTLEDSRQTAMLLEFSFENQLSFLTSYQNVFCGKDIKNLNRYDNVERHTFVYFLHAIAIHPG